MGRRDEAEELYRRALEIRRRLYGPVHPDLATSLSNLATFLSNRGDYAAAEGMLREVADMEVKMLGLEHPNAGLNLHNLGIVLQAKGDFDAAERTLEEALVTSRRVRAPGHREEAFILRKIGDLLLWHRRQPVAASARYLEALRLEDERAPEGDRRTSFCLVGLGESHLQQGDPGAAEPLLRRAVEISRRERPQGNRRTAEAESALGVALASLGRTGEASRLLLESYPALLEGFGEGDERVRRAWRRVVEILAPAPRGRDQLEARRRSPAPRRTSRPRRANVTTFAPGNTIP